MARNSIGKTILGAAVAAACAICASQASAAGVGIPGSSGSGGSQGGVLAPSASPYAILAPSTLENTPGGDGRAAFEGRPSLCPPGAHEVATNSGLHCKANR
jgi:hypothetical protein